MASNLKSELKKIKKIIELFYIPDIERSAIELDTEEERMARIRGREMDSTSKRSPESKEAPTTKS